MQVMTGAEFKQSQVIIGQQTKTRGFSVSDDPMLMSILSTGLYQNPLKSMIQEAVFNAWDAHKAAEKTNIPIEIVITDDNQLIISDSGFGIDPDDMYEIYCVYGASTKRDDHDQTGGFGLGCKAPFAYTDSFRVTSAHEGKRSLYVISRANDDNDGKPGITELVGDLDCEESGLIVSIPLKHDHDARKAYEILKKTIFPYSGINWSFQYKSEDLETGQEEELAPGKFVLGPGIMDKHQGLTAQYGGVAYNIPYSDEYEKEYSFLANTIGSVGTIRAGFESGTLTPLPSREGLNLSENTVKNLREQIQVIIEELNILLHPMMDLAIQWVAHCIGQRSEELYDSGDEGYNQSSYFTKFTNCGFKLDFDDILNRHETEMYMNQPIEEGQNAELVMRLRKVIMSNTKKLVKGVGIEWFMRRRAIAWSVQNGHSRDRFNILQHRNDDVGGSSFYQRQLNQKTIEKTIRSLIRVCDHVNIKHHLRVRICNENQSTRLTYIAEENEPTSYAKMRTYHEKLKDKSHTKTTRIKLDTLRPQVGSRPAPERLDPNRVVLAHTIKDGNHCPEARAIYSTRKTAIFVIGTSVTKMSQAKTFLEGEGYEVIIAPKYVENEQLEFAGEHALVSKPEFEGWPKLTIYEEGFASTHEFEKNPTMYILFSKTRQREEEYRRYRFSERAVRAIQRFFQYEKIVVINHPNKLRSIEKLNIQSVRQRIDQMVREVLQDPVFNKKLAMHVHARNEGVLPDTLLQIPEFSKLLGLPYIRSREIRKFREVLELFDTITEYETDVFCSTETRKLIKTKMTLDNTSVSRASKILQSLDILDPVNLRNRMDKMSDGERKVYSEKLARFIRTTVT